MESHYNYGSIIDHIRQRWKEKHGFEFKITETDKPVINKLLAYFLRDEEMAAAAQLDLSKGIMLTGPIGCGKTSLMSLMNEVCSRTHQHLYRSGRDISIEYGRSGLDVLYKYTSNSFFPYTSVPRVYCFDDIGLEPRMPFWGDFNVMAEILLTRYQLMMSRRMVTHVITTLSAEELEQLYGNRVRSCFRAMFNLIAYSHDAPDKRK
ncbi:P-loop NTPase family protein [Chitinophaga tropicalis]|uniref:ATPase n=1 Tax=Chitinophaga tropicalis TaxID=2683588 RepID=A0A7K1U518_9BACT|nr:ATPase [Chitinophaga tropicalis]MVT09453.1 ATPase [Chitinophaga tropicalis]